MASANGETFFVDVDTLQEHGISAQDIAKLKASGVATIKGVQQATRKNLCKIKGLSEIKVDKIKDAAAKVLPNAFITGLEAAQRRSGVFYISTGAKALDAILAGGIESQSMTEVYGEFRTGKTQMAHTLCVIAQLPRDMGGAEGKVAYIDTEGTFRPERIQAIADRFGVDGQAALDNIVVGRANNSEHRETQDSFSKETNVFNRGPVVFFYDTEMDLINILAAKFAEEDCYRLLIVDSIMALFRVDFCGRGELSERQQKLNQMLSRLTRISEEYNVAVFITNQVQADPGASSLFVCRVRFTAKPQLLELIPDSAYQAGADKVMNELSQGRVAFDADEMVHVFRSCDRKQLEDMFWHMLVLPDSIFAKAEVRSAYLLLDSRHDIEFHVLFWNDTSGEERVCKIHDSPNVPEGEATYKITGGGIDDA